MLNGKTELRVALIDDHKILLESLKNLLEQQPFVKWVKAFSRAQDFVRSLEGGLAYDLLITDLQMPEMHGLELLGYLKDKHLQIPTLVMSMLDSPEIAATAKRLGVKGICSKEGDIDALCEAVKMVAAGGTYFPLDDRTNQSAGVSDDSNDLSPREMDVLRGIARGQTSKAIADELFISPFTVQTHRKNILKKLQIDSTAQLLQYAVRKGLI